jgi:hypothetical protein
MCLTFTFLQKKTGGWGVNILANSSKSATNMPRGNSRIQVFDTEDNRKAVWNPPTAPWALCLTNGPAQVMFVGSVGRVYKMDLTGKILGAFGRPGRMPGTIDSVHGIACPDEKAVYLANLYASRIDKWIVQ